MEGLFEKAAKELNKDRELVLTAMKQDGWALEYAVVLKEKR